MLFVVFTFRRSLSLSLSLFFAGERIWFPSCGWGGGERYDKMECNGYTRFWLFENLAEVGGDLNRPAEPPKNPVP